MGCAFRPRKGAAHAADRGHGRPRLSAADCELSPPMRCKSGFGFGRAGTGRRWNSSPLRPIPSRPAPSAAASQRVTASACGSRASRRPARPRRGTVCLFQGRASSIEKYFERSEICAQRGFAVAMLDWRGQGGSDRLLANPRKGFVRRVRRLRTRHRGVVREVVYPDCPPPFFALAHSMGGTILIRAAKRGRRWFERTVAVCADDPDPAEAHARAGHRAPPPFDRVRPALSCRAASPPTS